MNQHEIMHIENTAEEYRRYAGRLLDTLEYFARVRQSSEERDEVLERSIAGIEAQIRELNNMADAMQEIVFNYRKTQRLLSYADIDFGEAGGDADFGISEFANLSEHEELIPIHAS